MNIKKFMLILALTSTGASAYGACHAGQMAKLVAQAEVSRQVPGASKKQKLTLQPGTEVHVISVKKNKIEIYAMNDANGTYINGLGIISPKSLACQ